MNRSHPNQTSYLRSHSQNGVIRAATLAALGVSSPTTYRRCQPGGPWRRLLPGIILLSTNPPTTRQRIQAALMLSNGHGVLTGFEAARQHGLRQPPAGTGIHLLIPDQHQIHSTGFVTVERTIRMPEAQTRDGLPLAPPARAILDALRRVRDPDLILAMLIEAKQAALCTQAELLGELNSGSRRGSALPRQALQRLDTDLRSVAEANGQSVWLDAGLPSPQHNISIFTTNGEFIAMPDYWCEEVALAWEIDSYERHYSRDDYHRTLERNNRYTTAGVMFVQTIPSRLSTDREAVVAELRAAYQAASRRSPPTVLMRTRPPAA